MIVGTTILPKTLFKRWLLAPTMRFLKLGHLVYVRNGRNRGKQIYQKCRKLRGSECDGIQVLIKLLAMTTAKPFDES